MKQNSLLFLTFMAAVGLSAIPAFIRQSSAAAVAPLDKRFEQCINDARCTTGQKLRMMNEMTDSMRNALKRIDRTCMTMNYKGCFNPSMDDVVQWHKMQDHMNDLAQLLELQYTAGALGNLKPSAGGAAGKQLNLIEPTIGPTPAPNPYTNPDQERLEENKKDWWPDWSPPNEANPYHNW